MSNQEPAVGPKPTLDTGRSAFVWSWPISEVVATQLSVRF